MHDPTAQRPTLEGALTDFYEDQEYKGNSPATLRYYRTTLRRFQRDSGIVYLDELNESRIRSWLVSHQAIGRATLATYDRCLRVAMRWLAHRGYLEVDPMARLSKPKVRQTHLNVFTEADIRVMLSEAASRRNPLRDTALVTLLVDTGLRIGEVTNLRLHDIDWQEGWLKVDGKTGARAVPFGRKTRLALRRYIDRERKAHSPRVQEVFTGRGGQALSTDGAAHAIVRLARAADAKASKVGPHTFRHTFALEFIRAGGDAFALQRILGHSTLDMTRRYVHLANTDLREAHKRFAPADRMSW